MEYQIDYERTVRFRTTVTARDADAAYDAALDRGDAIDGEVVALGALDEFSVAVREPAVSA